MSTIATCNACVREKGPDEAFKVPWDEVGKALMEQHLKEHNPE